METTLVIGNLIGNSGLIVVAGFFIKKWMNRMEKSTEDNRNEVKATAEKLAGELKKTVAEHRHEIKSHSDDLNDGLAKIYDQLRIANGRTAKIEGKVDVQAAICDERMKRGQRS